MNFIKSAAAMFAGRWQIPAAICALIVAGLTLYQMKPPKREVSFDVLLTDLIALGEAGQFFDAADAAANLLEMDPPLPLKKRAILHDTLADIIYQQELLRGVPNLDNTRLILEHHEKALAFGHRTDASDTLRAARAHEWLGEGHQAIASYRLVLEREASDELRRAALQALVRLLDERPLAEAERRAYIEALLTEEGVSPAYLWWALQHAVDEALGRGDTERAYDLLSNYASQFQRSDLRGYRDFLLARVHVHEGFSERAEPLLDRVDEWLEQNTHADAEMDQAGFLPAMSRWLRGRIHLAEWRPQAALEEFEQALALQSHGDLLADVTVGRLEALAMLERHASAWATVRETIARLSSDPTTLAMARYRLRNGLRPVFERLHEAQDYFHALGYLELALTLVPENDTQARLGLYESYGRINAEAAQTETDPLERSTLFATAARAFEQAADLARMDEPRHAALLWASGKQFDHAGLIDEARRLLLRFIESRESDPRMPQALLRLGQAYAADGQLPEAIEVYGRLAHDFSRLMEGARARLLMASCLVALGTEHYPQAEALLTELLEDEHVSPTAAEFRDALFELCDLLYEQRHYARAISHMEDFLVFYPDDEAAYRVRFMLADAYRCSALAIREDTQAGPAVARARVSRERLWRAAKLFGEYSAGMQEAARREADAADYERLALLYWADCLYELNEPPTLDEALAVYREAAARYQGDPTALTAQVQIANIHLRQGRLTEAARAIERAHWLLGSIPDRAFAACGGYMDRPGWDEYLRAIRTSTLFRDVFTGPQ